MAHLKKQLVVVNDLAYTQLYRLSIPNRFIMFHLCKD